LKLEYDELLSNFAFNFDLRHYTKEKKEIMWKGLPSTTENDVEHLRAEKARVAAQIEKKNAYLQAGSGGACIEPPVTERHVTRARAVSTRWLERRVTGTRK
jgi:hypothetical protein